MQRSTERILTTHTGALQRPAELSEALAHKNQHGSDVANLLRTAVRDVVARQVQCGIDVVDDGEYGKTLWTWYIRDRLDGVESRDWSPTDKLLAVSRDREEFADFYQWAEERGVLFGYTQDAYYVEAVVTQPVVTGPIRYRREAVDRDIANLRAALEGQPVTEAFMPVVAPASIEVAIGNEYYSNRDDLLRALSDAIRQEYQAIIDAGFILQIDDAWMPAQWDRRIGVDLEEYRRSIQQSIEVLNHTLDGLPEDRIRYHVCWGSWHGPHKHDIPLRDIVDIILRVRAGAYAIEAANARHEHEYHVWEDVKLPDGKILIPGVVTHSTNIIEHPELVAERIIRFAERVGRDNVIAGTDCGFGNRIHPQLGWAKLEALVEGARLASQRLWRR